MRTNCPAYWTKYTTSKQTKNRQSTRKENQEETPGMPASPASPEEQSRSLGEVPIKGNEEMFTLKPIDDTHINLHDLDTGLYRDFCFTIDELDSICEQFQKIKQSSQAKKGKQGAAAAPPHPDFEPYQRVLVRDNDFDVWRPALFSHIQTGSRTYPYATIGSNDTFKYCIPFNDLTKHLVNTAMQIDHNP